MDLIHSLSNLEIETHHPHSSSSQKEEEEVMKRNWLALPDEVMSLVLLKLGHVDIIAAAERVCSSWWKLSKQPHLYRCIHVEEVVFLSGHRVGWPISPSKASEVLAREAINRSCGQLMEFSIRAIATDELMQYMSEKSSSLRCLRLVFCDKVSDGGLIDMAKKLPQLEELEIIQSFYFTKDVIKTFGRFCPHLKSCQLMPLDYTMDGTALAIAETMPELCHLSLFGNSLTDDGLRAILHGCPHLQTLDLRRCFNLKFEGELKDIMSAANIKLRLPDDSADDFKYAIEYAPVDNYSDCPLDEDSDFFYYGVMF